jgi:hypothetical protein
MINKEESMSEKEIDQMVDQMVSDTKKAVRDELQWVQLTRWGNRVPSFGTMRNIIAKREQNGAEEFLSLVNGRYYIHITRFNNWMIKQKGNK